MNPKDLYKTTVCDESLPLTRWGKAPLGGHAGPLRRLMTPRCTRAPSTARARWLCRGWDWCGPRKSSWEKRGRKKKKKGKHSGTYKSLCWSCRLITQHQGCVSSYLISSLLTWLYLSSRLLMPDCSRTWGLRFTTEVWIRSGASCLTWALLSSGVHITWTRHSTSNSYSFETLSPTPTQLFL